MKPYEKAIYFDFESNPNRTPSLLGVLYKDIETGEDIFNQYILEPELNPTKDQFPITYISNVDRIIRKLRRLALKENRKFIAWSNHELEVINDYSSQNWNEEFSGNYYINAIEMGKEWFRKNDPSNLPTWGNNTLSYYMKYFNYHVPSKFGVGITSNAIDEMREELKRTRGHINNVPYGTIIKWERMLQHNRHDCYGMRHVVEKMVTSHFNAQAA
tara:strand:- start:145 stop:789 length:645 start_codon:yes stop_codon:yes gene_type:complete